MVEQDIILKVKNLNVTFRKERREYQILKNINFTLKKSKTLGVTGISGSGKSVLALSIMGLLDSEDMIIDGQILYNNDDLTKTDKKNLQKIRGNEVSIIFQSPFAALNPIQKCGSQIQEVIRIHQFKLDEKKIKNKVLELFESCELHESTRIFESFPHELSGGQLQRVLIAMAIANNPKIIIADEATSSLDKKTTREIIKLLQTIKNKLSCSIIFITHDLKLLQSISDDILVINNGEVVDLFKNKTDVRTEVSAYTNLYLDASLNNSSHSPKRFLDSNEASIISLQDINKLFERKNFFGIGFKKGVKALSQINIEIKKGSIFGILGKSGSGKSTLAKILSGIEKQSSGVLWFDGLSFDKANQEKWNKNRQIQMVFQDALTSLNPKQSVKDSFLEIVTYFKLSNSYESKNTLISEALTNVGLSELDLEKFPQQLSGGQRQRVTIAKVLLLKPKVIIFDESLSALDIFTQRKIMDLIIELNSEGLTCVFISHDPKLIQYLCDEILVLDDGHIIYNGPTNDAFRLKSDQRLMDILGD